MIHPDLPSDVSPQLDAALHLVSDALGTDTFPELINVLSNTEAQEVIVSLSAGRLATTDLAPFLSDAPDAQSDAA